MGLRALEVGWDGIGCGWKDVDGEEGDGKDEVGQGFGALGL